MRPKPTVKFTAFILFVHRHDYFSLMNPLRTQGYVDEHHKDSSISVGLSILKNASYYIDVQKGPKIETPESKKMKKV
jgi:hypothetical protein